MLGKALLKSHFGCSANNNACEGGQEGNRRAVRCAIKMREDRWERGRGDTSEMS